MTRRPPSSPPPGKRPRGKRVVDRSVESAAAPDGTAAGFAAEALAVAAEIVRVEPGLDAIALLAAAFRNTVYGIAIADARTNTLLAVNPAYVALTGRMPEDTARQPILAMYAASDRTIVARAIEHADRHGGAHFECRMGRPDGSTEPVEGDVRVLRDGSGAPRYRIATLRSTRRRLETEQRLATAVDRMRALAQRLEQVQQAERARIATLLHEGLMQSLAGLNLGLETLRLSAHAAPDGAELPVRVAELQDMVRQMTQSTRETLEGFHPSGIRHLGLWSVVEHAVARWSQTSGVAAVVDLQHRPVLPEDASTIALRALQEALSNVARHAHASQVRVTSRDEGRLVEISVSDDGIGIAPGEREKPDALGLLGASERLRAIGGELEVERLRPRGTRVTVRLPASRAPRRRGE